MFIIIKEDRLNKLENRIRELEKSLDYLISKDGFSLRNAENDGYIYSDTHTVIKAILKYLKVKIKDSEEIILTK